VQNKASRNTKSVGDRYWMYLHVSCEGGVCHSHQRGDAIAEAVLGSIASFTTLGANTVIDKRLAEH